MERSEQKSFDLKTWLRMVPYFKPYRGLFYIAVLANIFLAAVDIGVPLFQRYAINHFILENTLDGIGTFTIGYVVFILMQTITVIISVAAVMRIDNYIGRDLKWSMFSKLQTLSFSYYNTTSVGNIHSRVMSDTLKISETIAWSLIDLLWSVFYVVGVFVIMFVLNWKLAIIIIVIVPCIALTTAWFQKRMLAYNRKIREENSNITNSFNEGITGVKTSKSMVIEKQNDRTFFGQTTSMKNLSISSAKLNAIYLPIILFFGSGAAAFVLARGGYLVEQQMIPLGTLSVFLSYAVIIFEPVQQMARILSDIIACQAHIERVMDLLDQKPDVVDSREVTKKYGDLFHEKRENWEPIEGTIDFEDVSFMYPDGKEYVLEHFNLHIPAGTSVAIVGETGAGKSTLVNLVGRFYEPTSGRILIDGVDYRERSQLWLHRQIGYVLQNPHLFSGTILENIRYGKLDAADEEVMEAAKQVSADKVAEKMEHGYEENVGESGGNLSTGEKQLISFARAILAKPSIFVLDEATSSIDTETEHLIQSATEKLLKGHTSFVIAHRLSTIRNADLILVVKDGKVVERGTHEELLNRQGTYYELYSRQFQEDSMNDLWKQEEREEREARA